MQNAGLYAIFVGETLMKSPEVSAKVDEPIGVPLAVLMTDFGALAMWRRILSRLTRNPISGPNDESDSPAERLRLADLHVIPEPGEDFDPDRCKTLLDVLTQHGAVTVGDALRLPICVTLEDFFTGNHCKHSIAANVRPNPPYDTMESWYEHLKSVRDHPSVQDVNVEIYMVEPYEDGHIGTWPYADTIWVFATSDQTMVASLLAPLEPDEVKDASINDENWNLRMPTDTPDGSTPYWVWWD